MAAARLICRLGNFTSRRPALCLCDVKSSQIGRRLLTYDTRDDERARLCVRAFLASVVFSGNSRTIRSVKQLRETVACVGELTQRAQRT